MSKGNVQEQRRRRRARHNAAINAIKLDRGCERCGLDGPAYVLDFHHLDRTEKRLNLNQARRYSLTVVLAEVAKCVVLCANCHRIVEYELREDDEPVVAHAQGNAGTFA